MKKLDYTVQFVTPAFLGNAEQEAQWRTPPFKTMLRQWWRILKAKEFCYNADELRKKEGELFGTVAKDRIATKSGIQIRLQTSTLASGNPWLMKSSKPIERPSADQIYIGYGPVLSNALKTAIPIVQKAKLSLILSEDISASEIATVISLCDSFACLGSRSRNGWGSLALTECDLVPLKEIPLCDFESAFDRDWPHGVGQDGTPLIWKTCPKESWQEIMRAFSDIRKTHVNSIIDKEVRPYISYPVTGIGVFGNKFRNPSQLVFKAKIENGSYVGYIAHLPHSVPDQKIDKQNLIDAWKQIHCSLDDHDRLQRVYENGEIR